MNIDILGNKFQPKVFVIGVFHGDEPQGNFLIREYFKINPQTSMLLIPCLNNYGYENNIRTNSNGIDLNRNFPTKNWIMGEKGLYFGGESPACEIETQFIIHLIKKYMPKIILSLHAPYKIVNFDAGKTSYNTAKRISEKISEIINYPVQENIGYPTNGSFGTWAGIENDIPTITLELDETVDISELKKPVYKIFEMLEKY